MTLTKLIFYRSEHIVVKISFPDIFVIKVAWHLLSPMVFSHGSNFFLILAVVVIWIIIVLEWLSRLLVFFHVLDVPLDLGFERVKRVGGGLGVIVILVDGHCFWVSFLHVKLHFSDRVVHPGWRWLLQEDSKVLQRPPVKVLVELYSWKWLEICDFW